MHEVSLLIEGVARAASNGKTFERINPATSAVATRAAAATVEDADEAVAAAARAFPAWAALGPTERRMRLLAAADCMDARTADFITVGAAETGAMANWYGFNVMLAADMLREAAAMTTLIDGAVIPSDVPGKPAMAVRQPCGVVLGMAPWNAPVILATRALAMPLACGNTVVLKASEGCPGVHELIGKVLDDAGLGEWVVNVLTHAPEDASAIVGRLIANPLVKRVNFTGSTRAGRIVAEIAARHLKPALLELGGKAPVLVLDDADLDAAVAGIAFGAFFNQGQICMSTERVIVDRKVADEFIEKLIAKARTLKAGDPMQPGSVLGTLESEASARRIQLLVEDAHEKGARLPLGCEVNGAIMQPVIVENVSHDMKLYADESFGPVVTVQRVDGDEGALAVANDSEFGLSAAVFSRDIARALSVAKRIESGICHINGPTVHDEAQMPFGGVKASGYGRFGSRASIAEFTDLRWITVKTAPAHYPI
ncbi:aldehyde dehydrogenase [Burkholderia lata]|uniref:Aldehyde dehydrogenase n=1 Tax=Burkholderia lata (strain ATCC 17760 / DSM 23089 / LMG 22485 / NCIMB 9086 / R18194 / 383) TaxID=482957 RepID=A0A6P2QA15_BURL3|nr:aldehyde dehydrogenase [Burkholderia lata]VWC16733.1 aldehyde dehydrogenase [Burkholderia lata]